MILGLCGTHSSGKSTMAKEFAKKHGFVYIESKASDMFKKLGLDVKGSITMKQRLEVQGLILEEHLIALEANKGKNIITDRTPVDFVAYLQSEVTSGTEYTEEELQKWDSYMSECVKALELYDGIMKVNPLMEAEEKEGRARCNWPYVSTIDSLIHSVMGGIPASVIACGIPAFVFDHKKRMEMLDQFKEAVEKTSKPSLIVT